LLQCPYAVILHVRTVLQDGVVALDCHCAGI
jgi:hypothetical protein